MAASSAAPTQHLPPDTLLLSPSLLNDADAFAAAMDGVSGGRFLRDAPGKGPETPWLAGMGCVHVC